MKYSHELEIDCPRTRVLELFDDRESQKEWQPGLISFEHLSGEPGHPGAKSRMMYKMGKSDVEVIETATVRDLPSQISGTYESKGVWNGVDNWFESIGESKTRWRMDIEFKCTGIMRIMLFLMPGMFKKQTRQSMESFKEFAESA